MYTPTFFQKQLTEKILPFWFGQLDFRGGFYGLHSIHLDTDKSAPKSGVMGGRFLWTFSRSYRSLKEEYLKKAANHSYLFLTETLLDADYGGVYWKVTAEGEPLETLKHTYAQGFAIYGLSEYASISPHSQAKDQAIALFELIEEKAYDKKLTGYREEFNREWNLKEISQVGSGRRDLFFTTNTHLHLLEAYTNLYRIWPDPKLKSRIENLLNIFADKIYSPENYCNTEFRSDWQPLVSEVSYGHDIETSWLLQETLEVCGIHSPKMEQIIKNLAEYTYQNGLGEGGALFNHSDRSSGEVDATRVWWAEAEGVVGFYNAYQLTGDLKYLKASEQIWQYIQEFFIDHRENSEWFSRLDEQECVLSSLRGNGSTAEPISDSWKGPYHTVRMYIEMMERLHQN